jgi:signal transduction histidine kinase
MHTPREPFIRNPVQSESALDRLLQADWAATPLGPAESWSPALQAVTRLVLANRFPMLLWWGPAYTQLYNDAYRPILATKHPEAQGQPARECWADIWHVIGPLIEIPMHGGPATWVEDLQLEINRDGYVEETHFTVAYSPVPDPAVPSGIGGVLATVHEISDKVIAERRIEALRDLARAPIAETAQEACAIAGRILAGHAKDIPFALLYLLDSSGKRACLAGSAGVEPGAEIAPPVIELDHPEPGWPLGSAIGSESWPIVERLPERFPAVPGGPWSDSPNTAVVVPIQSEKQERPLGWVIGGVSARRRLDEGYRGFFELIAAQLATAIGNAKAREEAQHRADVLAAIDRAKTLFFSNVSHEFRTPLTLMLGPLEDALGSPGRRLTDQNLEATHRNALRLLRLVNALLDFSRIESGLLEAWYEPVDLALLTTELAGAFRPAIERAGLRYQVECGPLDEPVYVDRDKWEKVVLNLLSNAFKFTLNGSIRLSLRQAGGGFELTVSDTGTGIATHELPRLFERFHRIEGAEARSYEGSGIGLALVRELVRMHGAEIQVDSTLGKGTSITITLRRGKGHLPQHQVGLPGSRAPGTSDAAAFVEEALQWLPSAREEAPVLASATRGRAVTGGRLLVVDDSRDMRRFLEGLLRDTWEIETAGDGEEALAALSSGQFDVVLTDVMMPRLDGFGLLRAIRSSPALSSLSVVMLSASAEEAVRIEGLDAGADDYLVKPFPPRELRARLNSQLELSRARRHRSAERDRLHELLSRIPALVSFLSGPELVFQFAHPGTVRRLGGRALLGKPLLEAVPEYRDAAYPGILRGVLATGESFSATEMTDPFEQRYWNVVYQPVRSPSGEVDGVMTFDLDVTEQVLTRQKLEHQSAVLQEALGRASEADQRKNEFLATVAHELRSPLVPVMNSLEILKREDADRTMHDRARAMIERQVHQMKRLVDDLLDVSQIARSQVDFHRTRVDLGLLLEQAVEAGRPEMEARGQVLTLSQMPAPVWVDGDAGRLTQVFSNLLTNACKYTDSGGQITVAVELSGSDVVVLISDSGIGIHPALLERIFERFVQVAPVGERARGGMGIGLSLARQMVELHGGTVTAHSQGTGHGSRFTVRLPVQSSLPIVGQAAAAPEPVAPVPTRRVLLVDDNRDSVESLALLLALSGYETETAHDGVEAVRIASAWRPDIVLLDIGLPRMSGYEVCRAIRSEGWGKDIPVIALTGWGHDDAGSLTADAGFTTHLVKPVDFPKLRKILAEVRTRAA